MKLSQSLCVFVLGTILSISSIAPFQGSSHLRIAHRYDDSRIIFAVAWPDEEPRDFEKQGLLQESSRLPAPVAKLTGMSLWEPNEPFLKRHREILDKVRVGDSWVIMTGGETTIHCKIEKFAVATMACQAGIAAICSVASDEQAALKDVREKYYLAKPTIPIRFGSIPHSEALLRTGLTALWASSSRPT